MNIVFSCEGDECWNNKNFDSSFKNDPITGFDKDPGKALEIIQENPNILNDPKLLSKAISMDPSKVIKLLNDNVALITTENIQYLDTEFSKNINLLNQNRNLMEKWFSTKGINIKELKGNIKEFDGSSLSGTNQNIDLDILSENQKLSLTIDTYGNLIINDDSENILHFEGELIKENGKPILKINGGNNKLITASLDKPFNLDLILTQGSQITLGEDYTIKATKEAIISFRKKELFEYMTNNQIQQTIYYDKSSSTISGYGQGIIINTINSNPEIEFSLGGKENSEGKFFYSPNAELAIKGHGSYNIGGTKFTTDDQNFFKDVLSKGSPSFSNTDLSITFFTNYDGELMTLELNTQKSQTNEKFLTEGNNLLNVFIEEEIKTDEILKKEIIENLNWLKANANMLGLYESEENQEFLKLLEEKLTGDYNELIPLKKFISGINGLYETVKTSNKEIPTSFLQESKVHIEELQQVLGADKITSFIQSNLPINEKYVVTPSILKDFSFFGDITSAMRDKISEDNKVFITIRPDGTINAEIITKNIKFEDIANGEDIGTKDRIVISTYLDKNENLLRAKLAGIYVDLFVDQNIYDLSLNPKENEICFIGKLFNECLNG